MKKNLIGKKIMLLTLICLTQHIDANNNNSKWMPIGAKWHYTKPTLSGDEMECISFECVKDTIINGKSCNILEIKDCYNHGSIISREFIRHNNDSIFYFNSGQFHLLYNFNAKKGDVISVHNDKFKPTNGFVFSYSDSIEYFKYKVLEIDSVNIMNNWFKRQKVAPLKSGDWGFGVCVQDSYIIEKIGSLQYFFGRYGTITVGGSCGILRCYSDSELSYTKPDWDKSCDFITSISTNESEGIIKIYPNPAEDKIIIEITKPFNGILNIYDSFGKKVLSKETCNNITNFDINSFHPGVYFIESINNGVFNPSQKNELIKFIKK